MQSVSTLESTAPKSVPDAFVLVINEREEPKRAKTDTITMACFNFSKDCKAASLHMKVLMQ